MHPDLSFEQIPPLAAPLRFFLTAPWFGVVAGLVLAASGDAAFTSRWSPASLAVTHFFALGFMLQVMCGALFQFLPVGIGQAIHRPLALSAIVHPLLTVGTLLLGAGFLAGQFALLLAAAALLVVGIGLFALAAAGALWRVRPVTPVAALLRLALAALVVTALLGTLLAAGLSLSRPLPLAALTDVHLAWGLGGWALSLLIAVSAFVVPMFQLTPAYPQHLTRTVTPALLLLLLLWSLRPSGFAPLLTEFAGLGLAILATSYAITTLLLQTQGRRKTHDATESFFRAGMACLLVVTVGIAAMFALPTLANDPRSALWLGVLIFPGTFSCVIQGMLYKIVPFLAWLHLQRTGAPIAQLPNMRTIIPEKNARHQMQLHLLALATLLVAVAYPALTRIAGLLLAASYGWLGANLIGGARRYRSFRDRIPASAANRES
jgi:hypothetical protein